MNEPVKKAYLDMYVAFASKNSALIVHSLDQVVLVTSYMLPLPSTEETKYVQNYIMEVFDIRNGVVRQMITLEDACTIMRAKIDSMLAMALGGVNKKKRGFYSGPNKIGEV